MIITLQEPDNWFTQSRPSPRKYIISGQLLTLYDNWKTQLFFSTIGIKFILVEIVLSGDWIFFAELLKRLYYSTKHKKLFKHPESSLQNGKMFHKLLKPPGFSAELKNVLEIDPKSPKTSWVFFSESRPRMLKNRSQGWF